MGTPQCSKFNHRELLHNFYDIFKTDWHRPKSLKDGAEVKILQGGWL